MSRDTTIFLTGCLVLGVLGFTLIMVGVNRMIDVENNVKAIARIYRPGGCEIAKDLISKTPEIVVFKCGDRYDLVNLGK